jgi:hypothetical protein
MKNPDFDVSSWARLPAVDRPGRLELVALGLVLEKIDAEELPGIAFECLDESEGNPDLATIATEKQPSLCEHGTMFRHYLSTNGVRVPTPLEAALHMSLLHARRSLSDDRSLLVRTCFTIADYWMPFVKDWPKVSPNWPSQIAQMWGTAEHYHSILWDRLRRYPTDEELECEAGPKLRELLTQFLERYRMTSIRHAPV